MLNEISRKFIQEHRSDDVRKLALQAGRFPLSVPDFKWALQQIEGKQLIEHKIPEWYTREDILYPRRLSIEQCSSQQTAVYKASLLAGKTIVDLTGGWGVDHAFIAPQFEQSVYIEQQKELAEIAAHNFRTLGLKQTKVVHVDGVEYLREMQKADCVYVDPARRSSEGKKVISIQNCEPDLSSIQRLLLEKADRIWIKYSPMLDITQALQTLEYVVEIHIVSVENECKELLFLLKKESKPLTIQCVNLRKKGNQQTQFSLSEEKACEAVFTSELESYLYEPNASILKSGCFKSVTRHFPVKKLHKDSHLYTSDQWVSDFPGRTFRVKTSSSFNKKELKTWMLGFEKANLSTRNFPLKTEELRKKLRLKEGGSVYLFATTIGAKHVLIQCESAEK